jgi:mono/diheme cytochrome c family protein
MIRALAVFFLTAGAAVAQPQDPAPQGAAPAPEHGRELFQHTCAPCHGKGPGLDGSKMLPGAAALAMKYKGERSPFLEERGDLTADQLRFFVRHGTGAMPMFRKTEVTDAQIDEIAAYIASSARSAAPGK